MPASSIRMFNYLAGSHGAAADICGAASLVAAAPRLVAARAGRTRRDLAAPPEFPGTGTRIAQPRHGHAAGHRARCAAAPAQCAAAGRGFRADLAGDRFRRARTRTGARRARLHAGAAGAVPGGRGGSALEPAEGERRRGATGRVPGRPAGARCTDQPGRCAGRAGCAAAVSDELGRCGPLLHPQRGGGCRGGRRRRNGRTAGAAAALQGRAIGPEAWCGASDERVQCCPCTSARATSR